MFQHFLRRRPLYPTELRGLIQKIFNFTGLQDSNDSIFRRRPLYPTELRGLIQKIFNFAGLQDSNDSIFRRGLLYPFNYGGMGNRLDLISSGLPSSDKLKQSYLFYLTRFFLSTYFSTLLRKAQTRGNGSILFSAEFSIDNRLGKGYNLMIEKYGSCPEKWV